MLDADREFECLMHTNIWIIDDMYMGIYIYTMPFQWGIPYFGQNVGFYKTPTSDHISIIQRSHFRSLWVDQAYKKLAQSEICYPSRSIIKMDGCYWTIWTVHENFQSSGVNDFRLSSFFVGMIYSWRSKFWPLELLKYGRKVGDI